ncbi:cupin 2 domain-containing protein [Fusarium coicis]|nr:cupin 2 domain-containing protein [Fusarium coicis]
MATTTQTVTTIANPSDKEEHEERADQAAVPDDIVIPGIFDIECDERLWVPQAPDVWSRPLLLSVSNGYFVNILRGRWHYLEHPWWATEGGYAFETPGDIHTLEVPLKVPEDVKEMVTMFHVTGAYIYVDPDGNPVGVEDVFSKLDKARKHYEAVGLGASFADQFVR